MPGWLVVALGIASGITIIGGAIKTIRTTIEDFKETFDEAVRRAVEPVLHEIRPNGGGSFRDEVNARFGEVNARLTEGEERMVRVESKADALILNALRGEDFLP